MGRAKSPLEKEFERKCMKEFRKLPNSFWLNKLEDPTVRGVPDQLGCVGGRFVALEFKRSSEGLQESRAKLQGYVLDLIEDSGGFGAFIMPDNFLVVYEELRDLALKGIKKQRL